MATFHYYTLLFVYPVSFVLFALASLVAYRATRRVAGLVQTVGFLLVLVGNLFQNFGPTHASVTESGEPIIEYTQLFSVGSYLGIIGILVAALAFFVFAWHMHSMSVSKNAT